MISVYWYLCDWDSMFHKDTILEPSIQQVDLQDIKVVNLIMSSNNGKQRFIVDLTKSLSIESYVHIGLDVVSEMNQKITEDAGKFHIKFDSYRKNKIFFFDLVLPQHLKEIYGDEKLDTDLLKERMIQDINEEIGANLELPDSIGVLLMHAFYG